MRHERTLHADEKEKAKDSTGTLVKSEPLLFISLLRMSPKTGRLHRHLIKTYCIVRLEDI